MLEQFALLEVLLVLLAALEADLDQGRDLFYVHLQDLVQFVLAAGVEGLEVLLAQHVLGLVDVLVDLEQVLAVGVLAVEEVGQHLLEF